MQNTETLDLLSQEVAKILGQESIDPDISVSELGVDSLKVVELMLVCDQLYPNKIDPEKIEIDQSTTLRGMDQQFLAMN
ncbi:MAG: acyl carrier protein [Parvularculaceae bacterium]